MSTCFRQTDRTAGFTLIELLTVIAIIALLAAILFPVFAQAKESAKKAADLSNVSQLSRAVLLYAADADDRTPTWNEWAYMVTAGYPAAEWGNSTPDRVWDSKLVPYVKQGNAPVDPNLLDRSGVWHAPGAEEGPSYRSYGLSQLLVFYWIPTASGGFDPNQYAWRYGDFSQVDEPSDTIIIGDGGREGRLSPPTNWDGYSDEFITKLGYYRREAPWRYNGGAGYVFADGHAKFLLGDLVYPSPRLGGSPSTILGLGHCSMAKFFCPTNGEREWHRQIALDDYGVACN